jgi:hypothetical protein
VIGAILDLGNCFDLLVHNYGISEARRGLFDVAPPGEPLPSQNART